MKCRFSRHPIVTLLAVVIAIPLSLSAQQDRNPPHYSLKILGTLGGCCGVGHGINRAGAVAGASVPSNNAELHASIWQRGMILDLGTLGGLNSNTAEEQVISDSDIVAGFSDTSTPDPNGEDFCFFQTNLVCLPFVWSKHAVTPLTTFGGTNAQASGVNNRGDVVRVSEIPNVDACSPNFLQVRAVLWQQLFPRDHFGHACRIGGEMFNIPGAILRDDQLRIRSVREHYPATGHPLVVCAT